MSIFNVYYMHPDWFREGICGEKPSVAALGATHIFLRTITAGSLGEVYHQSQGEVWSPNGEARGLIRGLGLGHTSMSVGDVIEDTDASKFYVVARTGFALLN